MILLGPQGRTPTVARALSECGIDGRLATVTAGWQEREDEVQELQAHLDGRSQNLRLYHRAEQAFGEDADLARAHRDRQRKLRHVQRLYGIRIGHAIAAFDDLSRRRVPSSILEEHKESALEMLREIDEEHCKKIAAIHREYEGRLALDARPALARHREEIGEILSECEAIGIAGGHVAVLLNRLRLFDVLELCAEMPAIGWSAGAMVLSERIILYHDSPPQGAGNAEVFEIGLGRCRGVVPLPHAVWRLQLDDADRVSCFARRFAPDLCFAMDDEAQVTITPGGWSASTKTYQLHPDGRLVSGRAPSADECAMNVREETQEGTGE